LECGGSPPLFNTAKAALEFSLVFAPSKLRSLMKSEGKPSHSKWSPQLHCAQHRITRLFVEFAAVVAKHALRRDMPSGGGDITTERDEYVGYCG
jgi:hypothetical protein